MFDKNRSEIFADSPKVDVSHDRIHELIEVEKSHTVYGFFYYELSTLDWFQFDWGNYMRDTIHLRGP